MKKIELIKQGQKKGEFDSQFLEIKPVSLNWQEVPELRSILEKLGKLNEKIDKELEEEKQQITKENLVALIKAKIESIKITKKKEKLNQELQANIVNKE